LLRLRAESRRARQQATGEHVLLDEIGGACITLEQIVTDRDRLDAGAAAAR
jgi:hypothetical protein